jgi:hypothetical protein
MEEVMSALSGASLPQLQTIIRFAQLQAGAGILDVGSADASWVQSLRKQGFLALGLSDQQPAQPQSEHILTGSVAGSFSVAPHSMQVAVVRGLQLFVDDASPLETFIGLANVLSTLQPGGKLLISLPEQSSKAQAIWNDRLRPFGLVGRVRMLGNSLSDWLTLRPLWQPGSRVTLLEVVLGAEPKSRLAWHRCAREALFRKPHQPPAAA